ncbi:MAG TPA: RNA polymerase sigma factor [Proteobacteria bacterium]|nr:RNA polymerase sigma factor [Pseudomonadota bacterium]
MAGWGAIVATREDREIIEDIRGGNVNAFEELIARHENRVFGIVRGHIPADRVEEVAHDVFCRAYRSIGNFRFIKPFEHWLSTIAVRTCYDYWRKEKRRKEVPFSAFTDDDGREVLDGILSGVAADEYDLTRRRRFAREMVFRLLDELSPEDRMALSLVYLEGRPLKEAAGMMGWSVTNIKVRNHRARQTLKKALSRIGD